MFLDNFVNIGERVNTKVGKNEYQAKIELQKSIIKDKIDKMGAGHLKELEKMARNRSVEKQRNSFCSYDEILSRKDSGVTKIISQPLSKDDQGNVEKWNTLMSARNKSADEKIKNIEGEVKKRREEIQGKFKSLRESFEKGRVVE